MGFMIRFCVDCRERFGCVVAGKKNECDTCDKSDNCFIKKNMKHYSTTFNTGGVCSPCWIKNRKEKEARI